MSLEERFEKAVWLIRNGPKRDTDNNTKLKFYSFYKQVSSAQNPHPASKHVLGPQGY